MALLMLLLMGLKLGKCGNKGILLLMALLMLLLMGLKLVLE